MNITFVFEQIDRLTGTTALLMAMENLPGKLKEMTAGWRYVLYPDSGIELLASQRAALCDPCPHNTGVKCRLCGCPLKAKMRSPASVCPDGRWERLELFS